MEIRTLLLSAVVGVSWVSAYPTDAMAKPRTQDLIQVLRQSEFVTRARISAVVQISEGCYRHSLAAISNVKGSLPASTFLAGLPLHVGEDYLFFQAKRGLAKTSKCNSLSEASTSWIVDTTFMREALEILPTEMAGQGEEWLVLRLRIYDVPDEIPVRDAKTEAKAVDAGQADLIDVFRLARLGAVLDAVKVH